MAAKKREPADVARIAKRLESMRKARKAIEPELLDICRYIAPRKADIKTYTGKPDDTKVWTSLPLHAGNMLGASIGGLVSNPSSTWFNLYVKHLDIEGMDESREWVEECRDRMMAVFNSESNRFQQASHEFYQDGAFLGSAVMFVERGDGQDIDAGMQGQTRRYAQPAPRWAEKPKPKQNGGRVTRFPPPSSSPRLTFRTVPLWEIFVGGDNNGQPSHIYRVYDMTLQQAWDTWGDKCSPKVRDGYKENPEDRIEICHAVYPREGTRKTAPKVATNLPYACVYFETDSKNLLEESGYHEMPYMFWRWAVISGQMYGHGPGHAALPSVRVLNSVEETGLVAGEKMADPPMMVPDDGFLGPIRSGAGGLSYYRSGTQDRAEPLPIAVDLSHVEMRIERMSQMVKDIFLGPQLEFQSIPDETATVAMARQNEKMRLLGPVLGRLQTEFLGPLISRVFNIMFRAGWFPPMPDELAQALGASGPTDKRIGVEYSGPMAIEQRSVEVQAFQRAMGVNAVLVGEGDPLGVMDNLDTDEAFRWSFEKLGVPAKLLRPVDDVASKRQAKVQAAQEAQTGQEAAQLVDAAQKLGNTDLGPNTALGQLTGAAIPEGGFA